MTTSSLEDFEKLKINLDRHSDMLVKNAKLIFDEVVKHYECNIEVSHRENEIYSVYVYLNHEYLKLRVSKDSFTKKYSILCDEIYSFKNVTKFIISDCIDKIGEPKKIGVLSTKKFNDWIEFWERAYSRISGIDIKNKTDKDVFIDSLKNYHIKWSNDKKNGLIRLNGIVFNFWLEETYVRKSISLDSNVNNELSTFVKLSNNQLNAL